MSDFATKKGKPSAEAYINASYEELIERLNNSQVPSEMPFIQTVISIRTAQKQTKTNEDLVRQTRNLVWATWALCVITLILSLFSKC